jgi:hypothetical protein
VYFLFEQASVFCLNKKPLPCAGESRLIAKFPWAQNNFNNHI